MDTTTIVTILLIAAALAFAAATAGIAARINLVALGLLLWVIAMLVPRL
jgi:hypothetical protein